MVWTFIVLFVVFVVFLSSRRMFQIDSNIRSCPCSCFERPEDPACAFILLLFLGELEVEEQRLISSLLDASLGTDTPMATIYCREL